MSQVIETDSVFNLISQISRELIKDVDLNKIYLDDTGNLGILLMKKNKKIYSKYWVDHYPVDVDERFKLLKDGEWIYHMGSQGSTWIIKKVKNKIHGLEVNENITTPLSVPEEDNKKNILNTISFISKSKFHIFEEKSWIWNYELKI